MSSVYVDEIEKVYDDVLEYNVYWVFVSTVKASWFTVMDLAGKRPTKKEVVDFFCNHKREWYRK